jgi:hypothetical protein
MKVSQRGAGIAANLSRRLAPLAILGLLLQMLGPGAPATQAAGSAALTFDGTSGYVEVPASLGLELLLVHFTVEAWVKPQPSAGRRYVLSRGGYRIAVEPSGGGVAALFGLSSIGSWRWIRSPELTPNQWHHLAGTYDGLTMRLFVDGSLVASAAQFGTIDRLAGPLRVGTSAAAGDFFAGAIDEVRISDSVRYSGNFARPSGPFAPDASARGLWHFDEGAGSSAADAAVGGTAGSLRGGVAWTTSDSPWLTAPSPTATPTRTPLPTATFTAVPTATRTPTPLPTVTRTPTAIPTATSTSTPVPTQSATGTASPTLTPILPLTPTLTPILSLTATPSVDPTDTPDPDAPTPSAPTATITRTPTNAPTPTDTPEPPPTAPPTSTATGATAGQPCPQALHDSIVTTGPDGLSYPTWHPAVDPQSGCFFGHEHGSDPRTSAANPELPPFGYVGTAAGVAEAHAGFKVFIWHVGESTDLGPVPADIRSVFHMGTAGVKRYTERFHSLQFDYVARDGTGREAHVAGMADTGTALGSTCDNPRRDGRDFSTVGCNDAYEIWGNVVFQIVHPDDPYTDVMHTRLTVTAAFAAFDPILTRDPLDNARLLYTQTYRNPGSAIDPTSPSSPYRGCDREAYGGPNFWRNAGRPTVYYTDPYGRVQPGPGPGLIRQYVSAVNWDTTEPQFKLRRPTCAPGVHAPN